MAEVDGRFRSGLIAALLVAAVPFLSSCGDDDDQPGETSASAGQKPTVVMGSGDIQATVGRFRDQLGPDNGGAPGGDPNGHRELTWDKVPDEFAAPNPLPADFFNSKEDPTARGAVLATPGDQVEVSADSDNPAGAAVRFGDINPTYTSEFKTFSAERLFSPIGSNVVNLTFTVPGTDKPAVARGFGAVYTGIDERENTAFEYFGADGESLGKFAVPVSKGGLSFLGVTFAEPVVARVRIEYGNGKLGPDNSADYDVAVMDDFIYGEPQAPE